VGIRSTNVIFIWIGGPQLGIDIGSAGVAALVLVAMSWLFIATWRGRRRSMAAAGLLVVFGGLVFIYRTLVTPSSSWPVMYAAVTEVRGSERRQRANELMAIWHEYGQVRRLDWYFLSRKWNVCHLMWEQEGCRMPKGHWEGEGFVREMIAALPTEHPYFYLPLNP
jgi:hypothetical protein